MPDSLKVNVTTINNMDPKDGSSKVIDWRNSSDRTWLKNHTHWAMCNNRFIALYPMNQN